MNYELRKVTPPPPETPPEVEYEIIVDGKAIGRLREPMLAFRFMAMLDVCASSGCLRTAYGHGDTADEAIAAAGAEAVKLAEEFSRIASLAQTALLAAN